MGILSLVFWTIMLVVIFKYLIFILRADNDGEGGVMSLLALILSRKKIAAGFSAVVLLGLVGTSLLLAEGMITPAISVLSAIEGLEIATPGLQMYIIPLALVILFFLFTIQKKGAAHIGRLFGPVMVVWFSVIAVLGVVSIAKAPQILKAVSPYYAINFFHEHGLAGIIILGSVVLCITGAEALYADIGHFGKKPIRFSWCVFVLPALLLNYFGQGAAVLVHGDSAVSNPFYFLAPSWFLYPLIVIATAAAVIASQALISGAFSLVQQVMQLGYLSKLKIIHTSGDMHGQIYIPSVNYSLMFCCMFLVLFFRTSSNLASAYGISVMGTMVCTSILFFVVTRHWRWNIVFSVTLILIFLSVDCSFLFVNLSKIRTGGWFPIVVAVILFSVMKTWKWGNMEIFKFMSAANIPFENFLSGISSSKYEITRIKGAAIFMVGNPASKLSVLLHHVKHNKVLHEQVILLSVGVEKVPFVHDSNRLQIKKYDHGFSEIRALFGYMESPNIFDIIKLCNAKGYSLDAYQTSYYMGRVTLKAKPARKFMSAVKALFFFMHRNAYSATEFFALPPGRVIEIGAQIEI